MVAEFLESLPPKHQSKALREIDLLEEFGNSLKEPYVKHIEGEIWELRIKFASDISRIFYFFVVDNKIILTNGFIKKTMRTPKAQLDLARKYKADYERRHTHE